MKTLLKNQESKVTSLSYKLQLLTVSSGSFFTSKLFDVVQNLVSSVYGGSSAKKLPYYHSLQGYKNILIPVYIQVSCRKIQKQCHTLEAPVLSHYSLAQNIVQQKSNSCLFVRILLPILMPQAKRIKSM